MCPSVSQAKRSVHSTEPFAVMSSVARCKNINRSHTHTPTENNTPDTDTHTHTTRTTPQTPKRTPPTNT